MHDVPPGPKAAGDPTTEPAATSAAAPSLVPAQAASDNAVPSIAPEQAAAAAPVEPSAPARDDVADRAADHLASPTPDKSRSETPVANGIGVLLVNLGTPDAAEPKAVRRYLKEFLTDARVIEKDTLAWKAVLNGVILPLRSRRKARDYRSIWNRDKDESPLKTITRAQAEKLAALLDSLGTNIVVDWAMRYASPSIASRLEALTARGCERILVMPLYPQYAAATTATVCDVVFRHLMGLRRQPALRILPAYYEADAYIDALASSLKATLGALSFQPEVIVASYHGMPAEYVAKGDPYESQCIRTTQLLRERLGLDDSKLMLTFQSRFGRAVWLKPYTIDAVKALAKKGIKHLAVITPGFAADCLETLEEIAVENARVFKRYGGQNFVAIPCLNASDIGMQMLRQLAVRELQGWVESTSP